MMVIGRSKLNSKSSWRKGRQNGYASGSGTRDGSSQIRLRYGAGILIVRFRREAMRSDPKINAASRSNPNVILLHTIWNITRTFFIDAQRHLPPLPQRHPRRETGRLLL